MESIIRDAMTKHLLENKLIHKSQHGFLKDRSCVTNLLEILEKATTVVDSGKGFDVVYLDFAKAFDKVPYQWRDSLTNAGHTTEYKAVSLVGSGTGCPAGGSRLS